MKEGCKENHKTCRKNQGGDNYKLHKGTAGIHEFLNIFLSTYNSNYLPPGIVNRKLSCNVRATAGFDCVADNCCAFFKHAFSRCIVVWLKIIFFITKRIRRIFSAGSYRVIKICDMSIVRTFNCRNVNHIKVQAINKVLQDFQDIIISSIFLMCCKVLVKIIWIQAVSCNSTNFTNAGIILLSELTVKR